MKPMVEKFGVEKTSRTPASSGVSIVSQSGSTANPGGGGRYVEFTVPGGSGGIHVDGNDDTAGHCVRYVLWPGSGKILDWRITKRR